MPLGDPLVICRQILLADPAVTALVAGEVYSTPILPPGKQYPLVKFSYIGASSYTPVGFRQGLVAQIQMDVWSYSQSEAAAIGEAALDVLHGMSPVDGAIYITPTLEVREIDETVQPPLHRVRADLAVRLVRTQMATP